MKFKIGYAKTGRSICRCCESSVPRHTADNAADNIRIAKGTLRIATVQQADRFDNVFENWYHIDCLFDGLHDHDTPYCLDEIEGIQSIRHVDLLSIVSKINETPSELGNPRFINSNALDATITPIIAQQNELYYKIYDALDEKCEAVPERQKKRVFSEILDLNEQAKLSPTNKKHTKQMFLTHVADVMAFGAMEVCSKCSNPGYIFDGTYGYVCIHRHHDHGGIQCNNRKRAPQRLKCNIPNSIKDIYPILKEPCVPTIRMLYNLVPPVRPVPPINVELETSLTKAVSGKQILKYGTVVDSLSGMENHAHVLSPEYAVILSNTKSQANKNSFCKIQLLESDDNERYWLFVHNGRIGTSGTHNLTQCTSREHGLQLFLTKYSKFHDEYRYRQLDIDYSDEVDEAAELLMDTDIPSTLPESVQRLIEMCFDTQIMKETMIELELDLSRIPLGKLSKEQIEKGYNILTKMLNAVNNGSSNLQFIHLSDQFYTCIPHDFGPERPPVIDNLRRIGEKWEMLENLSDIQLTYSLLSTDNDTGKSTVDNCYDKLKTNIEPLDRSSELFTFLEQYVKRTHAPTHNFKLSIEDIFKITRHGEADRYQPYQNAENRYLLWHGSRVTNFVGILKNGLKIAPILAERTGDMFGNGIYFADVVTKSAQYCRVDGRNDGKGLLLLCEVALGPIDHHFKGFAPSHSAIRVNSIKGCGQTFPNPVEHVVRDGVIVPCGKLITDHRIQSELKYNELVVYDECRVKIEYLFRVKFQRKMRNEN